MNNATQHNEDATNSCEFGRFYSYGGDTSAMNLKIEVIKGKIVTGNDFEKFRRELKQFSEAHKVVSVLTAIGSMAEASTIVATILYE